MFGGYPSDKGMIKKSIGNSVQKRLVKAWVVSPNGKILIYWKDSGYDLGKKEEQHRPSEEVGFDDKVLMSKTGYDPGWGNYDGGDEGKKGFVKLENFIVKG